MAVAHFAIFVYIVQHKQNKMLKIVYFANCKKLLFCYNITVERQKKERVTQQ